MLSVRAVKLSKLLNKGTMLKNTIYKEMESGIMYVIARKVSKNRTQYLNGSFNPTIDITMHPDGAKHYETKEAAQDELDELQLGKDGFIVEEHEWL